MYMYDYLGKFLLDADHKSLYVLALICIAMMIDFLSGAIAAKINPKIEFNSKIGINGILRKVSSVVLLVFFIPLAPLIPGGMGIGLIYVLYIGYLLMELKSILENYQKMGVEIKLFEDFISNFGGGSDKKDKEDNNNG